MAGCTACHLSCSTCIGGGATNCTTCPFGKVFDAGSCLSNCQTPQTFNNSGVCSPCNIQCQTCQNASADGCTSCGAGTHLDFTGQCLSSCSLTNSFVSNNTCQREPLSALFSAKFPNLDFAQCAQPPARLAMGLRPMTVSLVFHPWSACLPSFISFVSYSTSNFLCLTVPESRKLCQFLPEWNVQQHPTAMPEL